jgi:hypothetical protein
MLLRVLVRVRISLGIAKLYPQWLGLLGFWFSRPGWGWGFLLTPGVTSCYSGFLATC